MCGIAGAFALDATAGPPLTRDALTAMTDAIAHRGPDDGGYVIEHGAALAARRLSIVDVDGGHQPMASEDSTVWAVQNGELYNHRALRSRLEAAGHRFRTRCDTEVLPHLYEEHGPALCERLRGMFGLAVWDGGARRGLLARDRLGIKPLYYADVGDALIFASELKAVVASGRVGDALDREALAAYLTLGFVPAPRTPLAAVRKLLPGERLVIGGGRTTLERWWRYPTPPPVPQPLREAEAAERLIGVLDEAVTLRLMADVPVGAMLSGGLDSSVLVALMARHMRDPVQSFSVGFTGVGADGELPDARRVAAAVGADHHELELPFGGSDDELATLAWHLDEPVADVSAIGFHALCELAARHVKVAISGQGADELLGGYRRHLSAGLVDAWLRLPRPVRVAAAAAARGTRHGRLASLARSLQAPDPAARLLGSIGLLHPDVRDDLYGGALAEYADAAERCARAECAAIPQAPAAEAALYLDAQLGLADHRLHYFDRASMASSLEIRVPFLDHRVVETCVALPTATKIRGLQGKRALRRAAEPLVPRFVLQKPKVGFLDAAAHRWLARAPVHGLLAGDEPRLAELVDPSVVRGLVHAWRAGDRRHAHAVLVLLMLELWLSVFLPRAFAGADRAAGGPTIG